MIGKVQILTAIVSRNLSLEHKGKTGMDTAFRRLPTNQGWLKLY